MITGSESPCEVVHPDWADQTCQSLRATFGAPFQLWVHDVAWQASDDFGCGPARLGEGVGQRDGADEPPADLLAALDGCGDQPRTMLDETGAAVWLAVPLAPPDSTPAPLTTMFDDAAPVAASAADARFSAEPRRRVAAIGRIPGSNEALVLKLAEMFLRDDARQAAYDCLAGENETLLHHITNSFEELSFLRTMAALLDVSDRAFDVKAMAHAMLPTLRPLCEAASIVLLEVNPHDPESPATPKVWCGPRTIDDATCSRLVQTFRTASMVRPVVHNDFQNSDDAGRFPGVDGFILVPVVNANGTVGWLLALNRQNQHHPQSGQGWNVSFLEFGTHEATLMVSTATILATHARNTDLFRERERLVVSVVRALVTAIEAKDKYTRGHSERVALYGKRLAEELGFDAEYCERLYLTGLLHDVGKIGVSDAVLRKPGALTPDEIDEIKQHPDKGWAILADVEPLTYVLPGLLHHHEQFDGGGYPDALKGTDIHIDGRILAVADAYDAMTSDRPYRRGMPHEQAEQILRAGSGRQWDAEIIEVFFRVMPDILEIKQNYRPRRRTTRKKTTPDSQRHAPASAGLTSAAPTSTAPTYQLD